jgi:hypothetical protein
MAMHGGPLANLERGDLQVSLAPALGMRMRDLSFRGVSLLKIPADPAAKGYAALHGGYERASPAWVYGELDETAAATSTNVLLRSVGGPGAAAGPVTLKRVELLSDDALRVSLAFPANTARGARSRAATCTHVMEYEVKAGEPCAVSVLDAEGRWTALELIAPADDAEAAAAGVRAADLPPALQAVRIEWPARRCALEDRYVRPAVTGGRVRLDPRAGVLTTSVASAPGDVPAPSSEPWSIRDLRCAPLRE